MNSWVKVLILRVTVRGSEELLWFYLDDLIGLAAGVKLDVYSEHRLDGFVLVDIVLGQ